MENTGKKHRKLWLAAALLCLAAVGGVIWYCRTGGGNEGRQADRRPPEAVPATEDMITASGTTMTGMTEVKFELSALDTDLTIEELYLSRGDEVEAGDKILKISDESIEEAGKELTRIAEEAKLAYRRAAVENQVSRIEAKQEYDVTLAETEYAQNEYENSLAQAREEIGELTEKAEDAKELYEEYYDGIYHKGYEEEYEISQKKELYEQNEALYWDSLKKWNIDDKEVNNSGYNPGGGGKTAASEDKKWKITALELLEDTYRAEKEDYEQALEDYENAVAKAEAGIEQAKTEYELLSLELEQAQITYEKKAAACLADFETQTAKGDAALGSYETTVKKLEEELETLLADQEEAQENLSVFQEAVGDGYLYTESAGTVVMVAVSEEGTLEPDSVVLAYSDPQLMTVTAAVDQSDIASVTVGEKACVLTQDNEMYEGTVTQINPISGSSSRAAVTYSVEITLGEDASELGANKTVTAYFGVGKEELENKPDGGNHS